jgi:hypothetical protein
MGGTANGNANGAAAPFIVHGGAPAAADDLDIWSANERQAFIHASNIFFGSTLSAAACCAWLEEGSA